MLILAFLFFFGTTVSQKEKFTSPSAVNPAQPAFNFSQFLQEAKQKLTVNELNYVNNLENSISRGDIKEQQIKVYNRLASFWQDTVHQHELYNYYTSQSAKLVNSEKNLTFAAQLILGDLRNENDVAKRGWKSEQAIELFEKAIALNPENDNLKVGLGSCYIFGKGMTGSPEETMKGIQQLLQVVRKDSTNMQAQLVLGIGGVISRQYDKAIERLKIVIKNEPSNLQAISWLADAYADKGDKDNAKKWYEISKRMINDPAYSKEVDKRIKSLN